MPRTRIKEIVCTTCVMAILGITQLHAADYIRSEMPSAKRVGEGRLTYMFWDVYDAVLYAPDGQWSQDKPYALQLSYLRDIKGEKIADRSVQEMRNQGVDDEVKLAMWHAQMEEIFPDVQEGDVLTGLHTREGHTVFFENGAEIGRIKDSEFSKRFFDIWLHEKTSAPDLRRKLLGMS